MAEEGVADDGGAADQDREPGRAASPEWTGVHAGRGPQDHPSSHP
jgi:hypothetical protein